jgi:hypothetical protein
MPRRKTGIPPMLAKLTAFDVEGKAGAHDHGNSREGGGLFIEGVPVGGPSLGFTSSETRDSRSDPGNQRLRTNDITTIRFSKPSGTPDQPYRFS